MDRFELNWPGADASFYTDGWRCRIVWRQKGRRGGGGMGGTIDNNLQCVKRAAESLEAAPYLLSALKARGHDRLAEQIESAAAEAPAVEPAVAAPVRNPARAERHERRKAAENRPAPKRVQPQPAAAKKKPPKTKKAAGPQDWLNALEGDASYAEAKNKRAKTWIELGVVAGENLLLKTPAEKGKAEWVLKRTWPDDGKRKPEYVVAESFKGIASFLLAQGAQARDLEQVLGALAEASHEELTAAARAWRSACATH